MATTTQPIAAACSATRTTTINDLPDVILSNILASVSDTRTRNSLSLVNHKFLILERATRTSLTLRGNARDLYMIPTCFRSVTHLDLSLLSPWGHSLLLASSDPHLLAHRLRVAFPLVASLTVYARSPATLHILLCQWPRLSRVKLVRWHQRPSSLHPGEDFVHVFEQCGSLASLDLSNFYYWTEDLPPVLQACPAVSKSLTCLDLLTVSLSDGLKSHEIRAITAACGNLTRFLAVCMFDPSYIGFVGEETLLEIASNCPKLMVLHLVDTAAFGSPRGEPRHEEGGGDDDDAGITRVGLVEFFAGLPQLEELVLDVCKNVRDTCLALEELGRKCPRLKVLKLGQFYGICLAVDSRLDGIALCSGLESLSIKKSADLTDMGLIEIARGCCKLAKFEVEGCKNITVKGMRTLACLLRKTLVEVRISSCKNLNTAGCLRALEPISDRIEKLHVDCIWDGVEEIGNQGEGDVRGFNLNEDGLVGNDDDDDGGDDDDDDDEEHEYASKKKKCRYSSDADYSCMQSSNGNGLWTKSWDRLRYLSLWIGVGELLNPLPLAGLEDCPKLEEIRIKVEGDCRGRQKPSELAFGLSSLACYPRLSKMQLDCSDTIGFALTAPSGQMDLSLWERYFLNGIGVLSLTELDYWPPQDRDVNQRSVSLPGAGLLAECLTLRRLFIHGTAHEHFMTFLLRIPGLRDVQLREDYYPAPENDMSTEMRVDSCSRFEDALNRRHIFD